MYNPPSNSFSKIKYSFGGKRPETVSYLSPGPGAYDSKGAWGTKYGVIPKDKRGELTNSNNMIPGPGTYDMNKTTGFD
jgi:hypothetical protein